MQQPLVRLFWRVGIFTILTISSTSLWAQVLNAPRQLTRRITATGNVHLGWVDNNTATDRRFSLERRVGTSGTFQQIAIIAPEQRKHVDKTVQAGTTYQYRVRTFRNTIYSGYSNTVQAKLPGVATPAPSPTPTPTPTPTSGVLMYSYEASLANGRALNGATLDRRVVYLYISNASLYNTVNFYCCKGLAGAATGDIHLDAVLDQTAPFSHSVDLSQLNGGTRELYVDAMKADSASYDSISATFILKDGVAAPAPSPTPTPTPTPSPSPGAQYTPLIIENFDGGQAGQGAAGWDRAVIVDTARSLSGGKAARIELKDGQNFYGGTKNLPQAAGPGETIWYRVYLYMPDTLSLSYGDTSGDGFGWNKFLVLSRYNHEAPRMYLQPRSAYKVNLGQPGFIGTGLFVNHDSLGSEYCGLQGSTYSFPRNRWFALQMSWKIATDSSAHIRVWSDDQFLGECVGAGRVSSGYQVQNFGIGDYWNGGGWIKNGSTGAFWMDSVVVTKQRPNTVDSGGRPYIHPNDFR